MGFSNLDKAGLLIEGFEEQNTMITLYNAPYYREHLEALGYSINAKWVEYEIKIADFEESPEKVKRFSKLIMERYQLKLLEFKSKNDIRLEVFNTLGQLMIQKDLLAFTSGVETINLRQASSGVYYVRVSNNNASKMLRFLKKN